MTSHLSCLRPMLAIAALLTVGACAGPAFDIGSAESALTPRAVAENPALANLREIAWGGVLVNGKNLAANTQLEIVGYPLDDNNRPKPEAGPLGRFIVIHSGYLETADYAPGRLVTVVGTVTETRAGKVGEASYVYPVVTANRLHLWSKEPPVSNEPRFHFGIGIGVIR